MRTIKQDVNVTINGFGGGKAELTVDYFFAPIQEDDDVSIKMRVVSSYIDCKVWVYDEETDEEEQRDIKVILKGMTPIEHIRRTSIVHIDEVYIHSFDLEDNIMTVKSGKYETGLTVGF